MAERPAGSVAADFPIGDVFVVGAVCAFAIAIVAAVIIAKAAVIVVLDIGFLLGTVGFVVQRTLAETSSTPLCPTQG